MKLTVDSSEPLEDAMRVLGALYGVTLVVSTDAEETKGPAGKRTTKTAKRVRHSKPPTRPAVSGGTAGQSEQTVARSAGPSNADVRAWARRQGLTVSDRGRVPASLLNAYRDTHNE